MKLKEKLARACTKELIRGWDGENTDLAFLAGFEKAREMAYHLAIEKGSDSGALWDTDEVTKLGEEEVE